MLCREFIPMLSPLPEIEELPETTPIETLEELTQGRRIFVDNGRWNEHLTIVNTAPLQKGVEVLARNAQGQLLKLVTSLTKRGLEAWGVKGGKLKLYSTF